MLGLLGAIGQGVQQGSKQYIDIMDAAQDREIKKKKIQDLNDDRAYKDEVGKLDANDKEYESKVLGLSKKYNKQDQYYATRAAKLQVDKADRENAADSAEQQFNDLRKQYMLSKDPYARAKVMTQMAALASNGVNDGITYDWYAPNVMNPKGGYYFVGRDKDGKEIMRQTFDPSDDKGAEAMFNNMAPYFGSAATRQAAQRIGLENKKLSQDADQFNRTMDFKGRELEALTAFNNGKLNLSRQELEILRDRVKAMADQNKYGSPVTLVDANGNRTFGIPNFTNTSITPFSMPEGYKVDFSATDDSFKLKRIKELSAAREKLAKTGGDTTALDLELFGLQNGGTGYNYNPTRPSKKGD